MTGSPKVCQQNTVILRRYLPVCAGIDVKTINFTTLKKTRMPIKCSRLHKQYVVFKWVMLIIRCPAYGDD